MIGTWLPSQDRFATTRWSVVLRNVGAGPIDSDDALGDLARRYCYPVYAYMRRSGHSPATAMEIAGAFLGNLSAQLGSRAPKPQGHFRTFLLDRLNVFLGGAWNQVAKVNDTTPFLLPPSLETRYLRDVADAASPEQAYQRAFALEVLSRALERLQAEAEQTGHLPMYHALQEFLTREPVPGQLDAIGERLKFPPLALVVALKRLRQRFRELAALELADTVSSGSDLTIEQGNLRGVLRKTP